MLTELRIRNFTIIQTLDVNFEKGMSVLTGETGAGKSVLIDAIELALGERADTGWIRQGEQRCEISLCFDITHHVTAKEWLLEHDLDAGNDCLIRRTLSQDGRSRAYINDQAVSLQRVKGLKDLLITIHGQHHNALLFDRFYQRQQLDSYLHAPLLLDKVQQAYQTWQDLEQTAKMLQKKSDEAQTKLDFLNYQLSELDSLQLKENEFIQLEIEQKELAHAERLLQDGHLALQKMISTESEIFKTQAIVKPLLDFSSVFENITVLLENAQIQTQEASRDLESYLESLSINSEKLLFIEQRLSDVYTLARKYRIPPEELYHFHMRLRVERDELDGLDIQMTQLNAAIQTAKTQYDSVASQLSEQRQVMAKKMAAAVQTYLPNLGMMHAQFHIHLVAVPPCAYGVEQVEFWMSTNPGQPIQPLEKILSGGELSRLNLAIQAVFHKSQTAAVQVFDEIDTGIGGSVAALAGQLMSLLSENTQVIAITHLPQVAASAAHHYVIEKAILEKSTSSTLKKLSPEERVKEMARMLGGVKITDRTMAHARELLEECRVD
jgi:DNA repair protein RecN (Recombination protein N)